MVVQTLLLLADGRTLSDYHIQKEHTLYLQTLTLDVGTSEVRRLAVEDQQLEDDRTLSAYNIQKISSQLYLREDMQIFMVQLYVKIAIGETITLYDELVDDRALSDHSIQGDSTISSMLSLCGGMKTLSRESMTLFVEFVDDRVLLDYSTQYESTVSLMLNLRGDIRILMKTSKSTTITTDVEASDVIRALHVSPILADGHTLSDCHFQYSSQQGYGEDVQKSLFLSSSPAPPACIHADLRENLGDQASAKRPLPQMARPQT